MANEGPRDPGTVVEDSAVGTTPWLDENNAKISDDNNARAQAGGNP